MLRRGIGFVAILFVCFVTSCSVAQTPTNEVGEVRAATKPGLALSIRCPEGPFRAGDEVPIEFVIENKGAAEYTYLDRDYDRSGRIVEYELSAVDEQGRAVPDPRAAWQGGVGGGLCGKGKLAPGQSFVKSIPLNRWALATKPGKYTVTGAYHLDQDAGKILSQPITVTLLPRTDAEMGAYIEELKAQLAAAEDNHAYDAALEKLVYTCDSRATPIIIEAMYGMKGNASFWGQEAFKYYLPDSKETSDALLKAVSERGMARGMLQLLVERGATESQLKSFIETSLAPEHPESWSEGALAAQQYSDDRFTPRLIAIATDPESGARTQAIYALALNRTDESVATLKKLLEEPDPPRGKGRSIRQTVAEAIRSAYQQRGNAQGRPLRNDDFGPEF